MSYHYGTIYLCPFVKVDTASVLQGLLAKQQDHKLYHLEKLLFSYMSSWFILVQCEQQFCFEEVIDLEENTLTAAAAT
jgi:hypothetical protein